MGEIEIEFSVDKSLGKDPWCKAGELTDHVYAEYLRPITARVPVATVRRPSSNVVSDHPPAPKRPKNSKDAESPGPSAHIAPSSEASDP